MSEAPPANQPLTLADSHIVEIAGAQAEIPVKVSLRLLPQPQVILEIPDLPPPHLSMANSQSPFSVLLNTGESLDVQLVSWGFSIGHNSSVYPATLSPREQPCVVIDKGQPLSTTTASILNFSQLYGTEEVILEGEDWEVALSEVHSLSDQVSIIGPSNGYGFTHNCTIKKIKNAEYSSQELERITDDIWIFLSFARGAFCGVTNVEGRTKDGSVSFVRWGTKSVEGWQTPQSWLRRHEGGDMLRALFPGFLKECGSSAGARETISRVIDWYAHSNTSSLHVGIILTQAALELLSSHIFSGQAQGRKAADRIRAALVKCSMDPDIPGSLSDLEALRKAERWDDGPHTLTSIRNDFVHAEWQSGPLPLGRQWDAWRLGQWYVEMMLLRLFGYNGSYRSRLTGEVELVPWAPSAAP